MSVAVARSAGRPYPTIYNGLGLTIGIVMPLISAALYPVYMHQMQPAWAEWTRLMELPFVLCELAVIHVGIARGYRDGAIWARLPRDVVAALVLLFVGLTVSSVFMSRDVPVSLVFSLMMIIHLRFAAAIFFLVRGVRPEEVRGFFPYLVAGLIALTMLFAVKFLLPPPAWSVPGGKIEWASALPGFINVRHFGSWAGAVTAGLLIALLYGGHRRVGRLAMVYGICFGLTCWSGTRGAVAAIGIVAIITALTLRRLPAIGRMAWAFGISGSALVASILLAPAGDNAFSLFRFGSIDAPDTIASGRLALWKATYHRWLDSPIFGWGSGSTFWEVDTGWAHTQPHNAILQFLISWGLIGAVGALWLIGRAIVAAHRPGMSNDALRPLTATLYALLVMSLQEGMLHYPRFIMLIMIGFAVILAHRVDLHEMAAARLSDPHSRPEPAAA